MLLTRYGDKTARNVATTTRARPHRPASDRLRRRCVTTAATVKTPTNSARNGRTAALVRWASAASTPTPAAISRRRGATGDSRSCQQPTKTREEQEVEKQLRLRVPGFEDEIPERDDRDQVRCHQRRQLPGEDHRERRQQRQRQPDVPALRHHEVVVVGDLGAVEERQIARVKRHPVALADEDGWRTPVPVPVDLLGVPEVSALIAASLRRVDGAGVFRRSGVVEDPERHQENDSRGLHDRWIVAISAGASI